MNWAPPTVDPLPPPSAPEPSRREPAPAAPGRAVPVAPDEPLESEADRRGLSAVPAAVWVAIVGGALLLVAAVAVVAGNWDTIGQTVRIAGLAAITGGLLVASERFRGAVPATASVIAHVATYLVPFVAIAGLSRFGYTWPTCLVVGGVALVAATHLQAERWRRLTMHVAQIVGFSLVSTGVAALTATSAGVVAAVFALGLLLAGAHGRSAALALLAVLSPVLTALADAGVGAGTLERAGLVGERLSWSGPAVGVIAAMVVGAVANRRRDNALTLTAVASPVVGLVTGLSAIDGSEVAWWTVPALVVIAAELGWWLLPDERGRSTIGEAITVVAGTLAALAWFAPLLASLPAFSSSLAYPWAIPITVTALAVALSTLRWRSVDSRATDLGIAGGLAAVAAIMVAFELPSGVVAGGLVTLTAVAAWASRRLGPMAILPTAWWAAWSIVDVDPVGTIESVATLALLLATIAIVLAARARLAAANSWMGWLELSGVLAAGAAAAAATVPGHGSAFALTAAAVTAGLAALIDRSLITWAAVAVGATGAIAFDPASATGRLDPTYWIGWSVAAAVFAALWLVHRSSLAAHSSAAAAVIAGAAAIGGTGASPEDVTVTAMLAAVAFTGVVLTLDRRSAFDAAAVTAGGLLLFAGALPLHPAWLSGIGVVLGLQLAAAGVATRSREVRLTGIAVAAAATTSWWFTTGADDWFLRVIEPADIRIVDLWLAAVALMALAAGVTLRATLRVNSWVAYAASMIVAGLWLVPVHVERSTVWALPLLLSIGVAATALGAWHRLAAPLVGGTVLTAVGVFLASGSDLAEVPAWVWLAVGGSVLLGTAVMIERAGRPGTADLRELVGRWR